MEVARRRSEGRGGAKKRFMDAVKEDVCEREEGCRGLEVQMEADDWLWAPLKRIVDRQKKRPSLSLLLGLMGVRDDKMETLLEYGSIVLLL